MSSNNIIVQEYLSSLKEDKELDYLFPILLSSMGYRIVQTAKEAKGQSQYGKDIVAIRENEHGVKCRWYFELKGYADKDITDTNYSKKDGIRESILEAKDTAFNDSSIVGFNTLPIKIVVVHNGVIKTNIRPTFDGLIAREFKEGEFERWDIYYLTDLFSQFLFSEYLLADIESNRLFKRTLAFLDTPGYDYTDFQALVTLQFEKSNFVKKRAFSKLFATLNLLESIVFHYSKQNNNLIAAKECSKFLILKTWSWILKNKLENREPILKEFRKLLHIQYQIFDSYFKKTFPVARIANGLFAENGLFFENFGYPLRCFEYLEDAIYYCQLRGIYPKFKTSSTQFKKLKNKQKDLLIELINNNSGFSRPILDNQSITIMQLFLFFAEENHLRQKDVNFITSYIFKVLENIVVSKVRHNRLPELYNRIDIVAETIATNKKALQYTDSSSILVTTLLELLVIFDSKESYDEVLKFMDEKLSYQIAYPNYKEYDIEQLLFEKNMHREYYVECLQEKPENFDDFKKVVEAKPKTPITFRTDQSGFTFLRHLAHSYFKNELLPDEWRKYIKVDEEPLQS